MHNTFGAATVLGIIISSNVTDLYALYVLHSSTLHTIIICCAVITKHHVCVFVCTGLSA